MVRGSKMMKGWIKCGLAGALVLMASIWGGSVRAAAISLTQVSGPVYVVEDIRSCWRFGASRVAAINDTRLGAGRS